ncbi:MAG TPA: HAD-IIIA family hydrolase [Solirubrobacteraceae bacterium]|nr:HAD-IIIA family hydrolase [Solirubrobacteraceae bacterium]
MSPRWRRSSDGLALVLGDPAGARSGGSLPGRAAFLDRDGTINEGVEDPDTGLLESPLCPADVRLLPGAAGAMRELSHAGFVLVCATNQPAAAKGKMSLADTQAVHERVLELLAMAGVKLASSRLCLAHPEAIVPELSGPCDCRKPAPGMLLEEARDLGLDLARSWMLGDTDSDVQAGRAVGASTALIAYPGSAHKRSGSEPADVIARDLPDAVTQLLAREADKGETASAG